MKRIDVLVVTAFKGETDAFRSLEGDHWQGDWTDHLKNDGYSYSTRTLNCRSGPALVALVRGAKGDEVTNVVNQYVTRLQPRQVVMCGICAGYSEKVALGDVIFASKILKYYGGEVTRDSDGNRQRVLELDLFKPSPSWIRFAKEQVGKWKPDFADDRPKSLSAQETWCLFMVRWHGPKAAMQHPERSQRCPDWPLVIKSLQNRGWLSRPKGAVTDAGKTHLDQLELEYAILDEETLCAQLDADTIELGDQPFAMHVGPLFTVNEVRRDGQVFERLSKLERTVLGAEMEGFRLGQIAETAEIGRIVVVKAVSDFGDVNKDDRFHSFAARASAAFLVEVLKECLTSASSHLEPEERLRLLSERARQLLKRQLGKKEVERERSLADNPRGSFFQKFLSAIYEPRGDSEALFTRFLNQSKERCFLVTGKAGKGKTSLLCRLAEKTDSDSYGDVLPILIDCAGVSFDQDLDTIRGGASRPLEALSEDANILADTIASVLATESYSPDLKEFCELLKTRQRKAVVFFDAINELHGEKPFYRFNSAFENLVAWIETRGYPVYFCLSCRTDFLFEFASESWPVFGRLNDEPSKPTFELGDYGEDDIERISQRYLDWYGVRVSLTGAALERCQDPLMLRYLCMAYTERPFYDKLEANFTEKIVELPPMSNLRRKEVFDSFVSKKREAIAGKVGAILKIAGRGRDTATNRQEDNALAAADYYRYASFYLLHIANRMFEKKKATLTALEVLEVAEALDHPDARLAGDGASRQQRARTLVKDTRSIFFHLLDEGIILEPVQPERRAPHGDGLESELDDGEPDGARYQFVFETYLEYTLGRYFSQIRWPKLQDGGELGDVFDPDITPDRLAPVAIMLDFDDLLERHADLVQNGDFTNLFGALQFAVLIAEDAMIYQAQPDLFLRMLERMSFREGADILRRLDLAQQACATIRETYLAQSTEASPTLPMDNSAHVLDAARKRSISAAELRRNVKETLRLLERLVRSSDFVIMWDVRDTLAALGRVHTSVVVETLQDWILGQADGGALLPMSALESLEQLGEWAPHECIDLLVQAGAAPIVKESFWLTRSWVHAVVAILRRRVLLDPGTSAKPVMDRGVGENPTERAKYVEHFRHVPQQQWREVQTTLRNFASSSGSSFIRGVALPALALIRNDVETADFVRERLQAETSRWVLWNLAFELRRWPWPLDQGSDVWDYLHELAEEGGPHVRFAVDSTALHFWERQQTQAAYRLRSRLDTLESPWRAFSREQGPEQVVEYAEPPTRTGIAYTPAYFEPSYDNHIECRERLQSMIGAVLDLDQPPITWIHPAYAKDNLLKEVHGRDSAGNYIDSHRGRIPWPTYLADIRRASQARRNQKGRTIRSGPSELRFESYEAAKLSAGGAVSAVEYVLNHPSARLAWSMGRPPGHLANNAICIFNNVAIGAKYALSRLRRSRKDPRILIVDCDAHHGIHTNRVFVRDSSVVYFSLHIGDAYAAEQGSVCEIGKDQGLGYSFNIAYPPKTTDEGYQFLIDHLLVPVIDDLQPDLIMISAGFDGHFQDPLTPDCVLTERSYIHLAQRLREAAGRSGKPVKFVGVLEGGYGLESMAKSLTHMLNILGDWGYPEEIIGFVSKQGYEASFPDRPQAALLLSRGRGIALERVRSVLRMQKESEDYAFRSSRWRELEVELSANLPSAPEVGV